MDASEAVGSAEVHDLARMRELLEAVVAVGSGLDLHATLERVAAAAADLVDARYGALGVVDPHQQVLSDFITVGVTHAERAAIGPLPSGEGLLGVLIREPEPLRVPDLAQDPRSSGFPRNHPRMHSFLGVPIRVRDRVFGNLYLTEKRGGRSFTEEDQQVVTALAAAAGVAIDNSRRYEEGRRRERWIAGTSRVATVLLTSEDPEEALDTAAEQVRELAEAEVGLVLLPTAEGGLFVAHAAGEAADYIKGVHVPAGATVRETMAARSIRYPDMSADPRITSPVARLYGPGMTLPMASGGRVLGALAVWRGPGTQPFSEDECALAESFAAQAALALRLADSRRDRQRLAVYEDRDRIARDLHDLVIQRLFATGMMLEGAARKAQVPAVIERLGKAVDELDATIQEVRTTIYALQHDESQGGDGLRSRVLREAGQAAGPLGFRPGVSFVGPVDSLVGEQTGRQLVAALREMLSNAARHARADAVEVVVDATAHVDDEGRPVPAGPRATDGPAAALRSGGRPAVLLTVTDDGVGIPEGGRRSGLANLASRAAALGGDSWHEPAPAGRGTRVLWTARL